MAEEVARYEVDPVRGFLPSRDPLARLPAAFDAWEATAAQVSELLLAGRLREALEQLPEVISTFSTGVTSSTPAMLLLCIVRQCLRLGRRGAGRRAPASGGGAVVPASPTSSGGRPSLRMGPSCFATGAASIPSFR